MFENNRKNIFSSKLNYASISLLANKIDVVIIGGGRAGYIKYKSYLQKGCRVTVISKEFCKEFKDRQGICKIIKDTYSMKYILDKHLVIIAVNDEELAQKISQDCEKNYKLYLNCTNFKKGNFINPVQRETESMVFSLHTKGGSPKTSQYIANLAEDYFKQYDSYVEYTVNLRQKLKSSSLKNQVLDFAASDDFKYFFEKGVHTKVLKMFYGGKYIGDEDSKQKK